MPKVLVKGADQMMISVNLLDEGLECTFADGCSGLVPYAALKGPDRTQVQSIELANPWEIIVHTTNGDPIEVPWDYVRGYCDKTYRARAEAFAAEDRALMGKRLKRIREAAKLTQEQLAAAAGIGRVTLVRIESGEQSPRYDTLVSLAQGLNRPLSELLTGYEDERRVESASEGRANL